MNIYKITKIQGIIRGFLYRIKRLPIILYTIQKYLKLCEFICSKKQKDGRNNSYTDEDNIIKLLVKQYENRIRIGEIRMWYDFLIHDYVYGWLPVNIKTTNMNTHDNTGNLAMCVYSYTDEKLDLNKKYNNGNMADLLIKKIIENKLNKIPKKDYYFLVIDKHTSNIYINSLQGIKKLTPNINNLPFQICWAKNKKYKHQPIKIIIKKLIQTLKKPKPSWKEKFMLNIRNINEGI